MKIKASGEEMDESYFDLVKSLTKEGYRNGKISEKYLRDTVLSLFLEGNGTVSSSLSWFFWRVSTHHVLEAKIIQEIKDNWLTQEKNWITLREEDLDKEASLPPWSNMFSSYTF